MNRFFRMWQHLNFRSSFWLQPYLWKALEINSCLNILETGVAEEVVQKYQVGFLSLFSAAFTRILFTGLELPSSLPSSFVAARYLEISIIVVTSVVGVCCSKFGSISSTLRQQSLPMLLHAVNTCMCAIENFRRNFFVICSVLVSHMTNWFYFKLFNLIF